MVTGESKLSERNLNIVTKRDIKNLSHWGIVTISKRPSIKIKRNKICLQELSRGNRKLPEVIKSSRERSLQELWYYNVS